MQAAINKANKVLDATSAIITEAKNIATDIITHYEVYDADTMGFVVVSATEYNAILASRC